VVFAWGYFLYNGVRDPLGGINSLWPLFGIANQLLAAIALSVATTILLKMHGWKFAWISALPLSWLLTVTLTASWQKIFSSSPRIGLLAQANALEAALHAGSVPAARIADTQTLLFNARLDAAVCAVLALLSVVIVIDAVRVWVGIGVGKAPLVAGGWEPEAV
jgi:carbon starvation protein